MFGMEKGKTQEEFKFDLELALTNSKKHNEIKQQVEKRIQEIKTVLREGETKEQYDHYGALLQGYTSILKVMARATSKK